MAQRTNVLGFNTEQELWMYCSSTHYRDTPNEVVPEVPSMRVILKLRDRYLTLNWVAAADLAQLGLGFEQGVVLCFLPHSL